MKLIKSRLFRLIIAIISLIILVTIPRSIMSLWGKYDIVAEREKELVRQRKRNAKLKAEFGYVQSQEFIEREAREKLGMVREGEQIVLLPKSQTRLPDGQVSTINDQIEQVKEEQIPKWKRWWRLFF